MNAHNPPYRIPNPWDETDEGMPSMEERRAGIEAVKARLAAHVPLRPSEADIAAARQRADDAVRGLLSDGDLLAIRNDHKRFDRLNRRAVR